MANAFPGGVLVFDAAKPDGGEDDCKNMAQDRKKIQDVGAYFCFGCEK